MIQNFGGGELLVILILALVVLGPERIPEMAKSAGLAQLAIGVREGPGK